MKISDVLSGLALGGVLITYYQLQQTKDAISIDQLQDWRKVLNQSSRNCVEFLSQVGDDQANNIMSKQKVLLNQLPLQKNEWVLSGSGSFPIV